MEAALDGLIWTLSGAEARLLVLTVHSAKVTWNLKGGLFIDCRPLSRGPSRFHVSWAGCTQDMNLDIKDGLRRVQGIWNPGVRGNELREVGSQVMLARQSLPPTAYTSKVPRIMVHTRPHALAFRV